METTMKMPRAFLGRMLVEAIVEDTTEFLRRKHLKKLGKEAEGSSLILDAPEILAAKFEQELTGRKFFNPTTGEMEYETTTKISTDKAKLDSGVPLKKAKIIWMAPDCYGEAFQSKNGDVGELPTVGDVVWFVPNETFAIDPERRYHLLNDCDVVGVGEYNIMELIEMGLKQLKEKEVESNG